MNLIRPKILLCSQDYGSTEQNVFLFNYLKKKTKNFIFLYNEQNKFLLKNVKSKYKISYKKFDKSLMNKIKKIIIKKKINFILSGLSLNKNSCDYLLINLAKKLKIQSASIQDFWGYTGAFNNKVYPNYFFVADKLAKKITKKKIIKTKPIITGLPKLSLKKPLIKIKNNKDKKIVLVIGQPNYLKGIKEFYIFLSNSFDLLLNKYKIFYLQHPAEKNNSNFLTVLSEHKKKLVTIINRKNINNSLGQNSLFFAYCSTLSYDLMYSSTFYNRPSIIPIFFKSKKNQNLKKVLRLDNLPYIKEGFGRQIGNKEQLKKQLTNKNLQENKKKSWNIAKKFFTKHKSSCRNISNCIEKILNNKNGYNEK